MVNIFNIALYIYAIYAFLEIRQLKISLKYFYDKAQRESKWINGSL